MAYPAISYAFMTVSYVTVTTTSLANMSDFKHSKEGTLLLQNLAREKQIK